MIAFQALPLGQSGLMSARPGPDLAASGYAEREYVAAGTARSYAGHDPAPFATRVVVRRPAARWLDGWAREGDPAPTAERVLVRGGAFVLDEAGNARGGIRTPVVDAPVELLRGDTDADAPYLCQLFGSTLPMDPELIRRGYADRGAYLAAYERTSPRLTPHVGEWSGQVMSGVASGVR